MVFFYWVLIGSESLKTILRNKLPPVAARKNTIYPFSLSYSITLSLIITSSRAPNKTNYPYCLLFFWNLFKAQLRCESLRQNNIYNRGGATLISIIEIQKLIMHFMLYNIYTYRLPPYQSLTQTYHTKGAV